jgi:malate dehydrogenase (oxaloacetate-decarboxylating)
VAEGATVEQANARTWPIDRAGLLFDDMDDLRDFQKPYAKNRAQLGVSTDEPVALVEVIKTAAPTILLGSSTVHGAFTREVIEAMAASTPRPVIMQLSNPTSHMEAMPADVLASSEGTARVATGSPVAPVQYNDTTYRIGQSNNVLVFPGIGRGIIISGARRVTKNIFDAAAKAVAGKADPIGPGEALLPDLENLREIATAVAAAVYHAAVEDGVATRKHHDLVQAILNTMGVPEYQTGEEI